MNMNYLNEFLVLAQTNNYQEAAELLFISQSSLSKHIMVLEKELGVLLFDRSTRNVKLSNYGQIFLPYADKIIQLQQEYISEINNEIKKTKNTITIASTGQMYQYSISEIMTSFKRRYNDISFDTIIKPHDDLKDLLRRQEVNFIFSGEPPCEAIDYGFGRVLFHSELLFAMLPKGHPLSSLEGPISIDNLRDEQFIMQDKTSVECDVFINLCKNHGFEANITSVPIGETLVNFFKEGVGLAILLSIPSMNVSSSDVCIKLIKPNVLIDVSFLYLNDADLSPAAKCFLQYLRSFDLERLSCKKYPQVSNCS